MSAVNKFLEFCPTDNGSNLPSDAAYSADADRTTGNAPGIARLTLVNKALRQATLMAAAIAQIAADYQTTQLDDSLTPTQLEALLLVGLRAAAQPQSVTRNKLVNGAQNINQYNAFGAVTPGSIAVTFVSDQWHAGVPVISKLTYQTVADAPAGLKYSMKVTVAAQYSPAAGDNFYLGQKIEGLSVVDFQLGTAGASTIAFSSYIKGSVAGTYGVRFTNGARNRSYVGLMTVTNSWSRVTVTFLGDVTGTWLTDQATEGLVMEIDLGSGTSFNTTAGSWQAGNFFRTAGCVTFVNQVNGSTLNVTGTQIEADQVTDFEYLDPSLDNDRCKRFYRTGTSRWDGSATNGVAFSARNGLGQGMMAIPTVTLTSTVNTSFPTTNSVVSNDGIGFSESRTANATAAGSFVSTWKAQATL